MLRSRQEREQLVRKFEDILPFIKTLQNFGWVKQSDCDKDPLYRLYPSEFAEWQFRPVNVNAKNGWHGEFIYRDEKGTHRVREGITPIKDEWSDYCYKRCCTPAIRINSRMRTT